MKKPIAVITVLSLLLFVILAFGGCVQDNGNSSSDTSNPPQETAETKTDNSNPLIGTWKIQKDSGETDSLFYYIFNDDRTVLLAMDNVAYSSEYSVSENESGKATLTIQLYYNLNGTYEYEFSDDGTKMFLDDISEEGTDFTMVKTEDYDPMPSPPENPVIDEKLVGYWEDKDGSGISYVFNKDGTMSCNSFDIMRLYAQYSAENGKINLTYKQGTEVEDTYEYSFAGEILTIDGMELERK